MQNENTWPIHVLILSMKNNPLCIFSLPLMPQKKHHPGLPDGVSGYITPFASGLLVLSGLLVARALPEVMIVGHAAADVGIEIPFHGALGKALLRGLDLLPKRVVLPLRGRLVIDHELALQHRVGRLVELDVVLRLQLDVIL